MPSFLPKNRRVRVAVILGALVVLLGIGYAGAKWIAWPMFKTYREKRANDVAREAFERGDMPNALLAVRKTLGYNQLNSEAWRLAVEITEKQGTPDVVYYQQQLANVQPTLENRLKFLTLAIKFNAYREADAMITKIGADGAKSPEFLEAAAQVSRRLGNPTKAKYYLMSLVSLQPGNTTARLELAQLRLQEGVTENKPSLRAEIRNLSTEPALRVRALSLLLSDSLQSQNSAEALDLADQLAQQPDLSPPNQILVLDAYRRFAPGRFSAHLPELQKRFSSSPEQVIILTNYLIGNEQAAETRRYIESLDESVRKTEGVQVTYAFSLLLTRALDDLERFLRAAKWEENEYARQALLAYRLRAANRDREFNEAWRGAMIEVGNNPRRLQTLLAQVTSWGWQEQRFELLWRRFTLDPGNQSIRNQLIVWEKGRGNTSALNRLFSRIVEHDPSDLDAKNNVAYTSMLLGIHLDRAYQIAREAYQGNPKNPFYATTQALALYRQGKYEEALDVMQAIGIASLTVPERTLLQSVILVANGRTEEGANLAMPLKVDGFLPEERRLLNDALVSVDRARREQGSASRLAALTSQASSNPDRKSWLASLPSTLREAPSVQMELSDSLYGSDDYKGLESALTSERWAEREFLRLALLSYAQRQQARDSDARNSWRTALAAAGSNTSHLTVLGEFAKRWNWEAEHIDIVNRLFQRDPSDEKAFNELVEHFSKNSQTSELAGLYAKRLEGIPNDAEAKSRFAYYSLLTNVNVNRSHILAREAYEADQNDPLRAKTYAFSLYKQGRGTDADEILRRIQAPRETGPLQVSLLRAAVAAQQNDAARARAQLEQFDAGSALPEESTLADTIRQGLPPVES
jgi:hypothetical protein